MAVLQFNIILKTLSFSAIIDQKIFNFHLMHPFWSTHHLIFFVEDNQNHYDTWLRKTFPHHFSVWYCCHDKYICKKIKSTGFRHIICNLFWKISFTYQRNIKRTCGHNSNSYYSIYRLAETVLYGTSADNRVSIIWYKIKGRLEV